ncbi:hypothetical protein FB45DRAFT_702602, partial [Roridomyces roridus]
SSTRIPQPWESNAPHFNSDKPEQLQQFLDHMEMLMTIAGTAVDKKKEKLVSYADYTAKREWQSLPSFTAGSFKDFIMDILGHYPSIRDLESGSISNLNKLLDRFPNKRISVDDQDDLLSLVRPMQAQVKLLV